MEIIGMKIVGVNGEGSEERWGHIWMNWTKPDDRHKTNTSDK